MDGTFDGYVAKQTLRICGKVHNAVHITLPGKPQFWVPRVPGTETSILTVTSLIGILEVRRTL